MVYKFLGAACISAALLTACNTSNALKSIEKTTDVEVYPVPHSVKNMATSVSVPSKVTVSGSTFAPANDVLASLFTVKEEGAFPIYIEVQKKATGLKPESYTLSIGADSIFIIAADDAGVLWATQTLAQLVKDPFGEVRENLPVCTIYDFPDIAFRGVVEGFYAKPEPGWSHEGRISLIKFLGRNKMNTFIYGPKDDPYHGFSGKKWREPYPAEEGKRITELLNVSKAHGVNFVWTVHTGGDPDWSKDPIIIRDACMVKFNAMYDLGVRSFGFFFDDVGGEGTKAENQAMLLNYINENFIKVKGDITPLVMCPTQYNKGWSDKRPGTYLDILGEKLTPDIDIMWTGNSVCCDITAEGLHWVNNRIKRPAYIWWNWPVQDYCRANLLLGPSYGNQMEDPKLYSGFTSNPMNKSEASQIGLFGLASYTWNMKNYDADQAWRAGIVRLFPECHNSIQVFANHNCDQGPNGHGYRRVESVEFKPIVDKSKSIIEAGKALDAETYKALMTEFDEMSLATAMILKQCKNREFVAESLLWLKRFGQQAHTARIYLNAYQDVVENKDFTDPNKLEFLFNAKKLYEATGEADSIWRKGNVRSGSLVVEPFVKTLMSKTDEMTYKSLTGKALQSVIPDDVKYKAFSNVEALKNIQAERRDKKYVHVKKILEVITLKPSEYIGLELPVGIYANYVHVKLNNPDASKKGHIELSQDGKTWKKFNTRNKGEELENPINLNEKIRFCRYINTSGEPIEIKLNQFKFDIPADANANSPGSTIDGDFNSAYTLNVKANETITLNLPKSTTGKFYIYYKGELNTAARGKPSNFAINQYHVDSFSTDVNAKTFTFKSPCDQTLEIYEIISK